MTTRRLLALGVACSLLACVAGGASLAAAQGRPNGSMPILVVTNPGYAANPFASYLPEILRGEGLVEFEQVDWSVLAGAANPGLLLSYYEMVVLAEIDLAPAGEALFRNYVQNGGKLVANRPDAGLADVFGINVLGARPEQYQQYFGVDSTTPAGRGITPTSLQYHGQAAHYALAGATALAWLYDGPNVPSSHPAATVHDFGAGQAVAFAFSLDKSVVLTRQGNPAWKDTEGDGISQYRPMDTFMRTDGTKYFDPGRTGIPQADETQRFLANVMVNVAEQPLPRMWYLPGTHKTLLVNTGDGEGNYGTQFNPVFNDSAGYGGAFTVYLMTTGIANTTVAQEAAWRAAGHELGVHAYGGGAEGAGAYDALDATYASITASLEGKFGHGSLTARNHTIDWTGWVDMAKIEAAHGTRMDMNYYNYVTTSPLGTSCYFNGTGLPQRFVDENGNVLPIYQATTQWPDEWFDDRGLTAQQAYQFMVGMFEAAEANGYYSAFVNNIHPVRYNDSASDITSGWAHLLWAYCQREGIPMWTGQKLLDFVEARDASQFENMTWTIDEDTGEGALSFDFTTPRAGQDLTVMLPLDCGNRRLFRLLVGGELVAPTIEEIKGLQYALFTTRASSAPVLALYAAAFPGDANLDGRVDDLDASILAANWQRTGDATWAQADFNGDRVVDDLDASVLASHWLAGVGAGPAVPEPSALVLIGAGIAGLLARRRQRVTVVSSSSEPRQRHSERSEESPWPSRSFTSLRMTRGGRTWNY